MRTTLDVDKQLLEDIVRVTGARTKSQAVSKALEEYLREVRLRALRKALDHITLEDNWRQLRDMELDEQQQSV